MNTTNSKKMTQQQIRSLKSRYADALAALEALVDAVHPGTVALPDEAIPAYDAARAIVQKSHA